jgi:hypothetical protein
MSAARARLKGRLKSDRAIMFAQQVGEGLIGQILYRRHSVSSQKVERLISLCIKGNESTPL